MSATLLAKATGYFDLGRIVITFTSGGNAAACADLSKSYVQGKGPTAQSA